MVKINLEDDNIFELETTVEAVRSYFNGKDIETIFDGFSDKLDGAQGYVSINDKESYLIIKITKE